MKAEGRSVTFHPHPSSFIPHPSSLLLRSRFFSSLNDVVVAFDLFRLICLNVLALFTGMSIAQADSGFAIRHIAEQGLPRSASVAGDDEIPFIRLAVG
ncbi:MAG TPA: hypothetical protein VIG25_24235 [Pyrinomonadaceae bacterium]